MDIYSLKCESECHLVILQLKQDCIHNLVEEVDILSEEHNPIPVVVVQN